MEIFQMLDHFFVLHHFLQNKTMFQPELSYSPLLNSMHAELTVTKQPMCAELLKSIWDMEWTMETAMCSLSLFLVSAACGFGLMLWVRDLNFRRAGEELTKLFEHAYGLFQRRNEILSRPLWGFLFLVCLALLLYAVSTIS